MTGGIEDVIKASRSRGGFRKKGYFTLATQKAKTKVSEYALPDPFFYCLEFVQSAVAVGAVYVDVATDERTGVVSFAGAHYTRTDMEHMFDFLITTRKEDDFRARRRLAIGIASALSLADAAVVVETGDGTIEGSTRFELADIRSDALIGTPKKAIDGTFIKVTHARYVNVFEDCSREKNVLLDRCEYLPIPLVVNGEMPFGFAAKRALTLHGYRHTLSFDEGDLYGAVAIPNGWRAENAVKILTNGIVMTSMNITTPFGPLDGVVTFDRLNKTASQYEIVQDDRVTELEERLKRYVDTLCRRVGVSDSARLGYLIDKEMGELASFGEGYKWSLKGQPFPVEAEFFLNPTRNDTMVIHFARRRSNGERRLIRTLKYDFPFSVSGIVAFGGNFAHTLRFLKAAPSDAPFKGIITFTPEIWAWVKDRIDKQKPELYRHFTQQFALWQREQNASQIQARAEAKEAEPVAAMEAPGDPEALASPDSASDGQDRAPSAETRQAIEAARKVVSAHEWDEAAPPVSPADDAPAPILSVPTGKRTPSPSQRAAEPPAPETAQPAAPYAAPFPDLASLAGQLRRAGDAGDTDAIIGLLHHFLYMNRRNHNYFAAVHHRVIAMDTLPKGTRAICIIDPAAVERSAVMINPANPLIRKKLDACRTDTAAFFTLALVVSNALKIRSLEAPEIPKFDDRKIVAKILECV